MSKRKKRGIRFPFEFKVRTTAEVWRRLYEVRAMTGLPYSELGRRGFDYIIKEYEEGRLH